MTAANTIADDDAATLSLANTTDGAEPATDGTLTVTQSAVSATDTVVALSYGGTASNPADYTRPSSVTIPAGSTTATITLSIVDDVLVEGSETVDVTLGSVTSGLATLGTPVTAANTIADDDAANNEIVRAAFKSLTYNFMVYREDLITSHEPKLQRLINRGKGDFPIGSNGFDIIGSDGNIHGQFAFDSGSAAHILSAAGNKKGSVSPVANLAKNSAPLNAWVEGQFALYRDGEAQQSRSGDFFVGYAGIDLRVNERLLVGLMGQIDWTKEHATTSNGDVEGTGWMVGPYLSAELIDNLFFDIRAMWGQSDNMATQDVLGSRFEGNFDTERWLVDAKLAGNYEAGNFNLTPEMSLVYMHEWQNDYSVSDAIKTVAVDGQNVALGRLATGMKVSYLAHIDDLELQPFIGGRLLWDFENPGILNEDGTKSHRDALRGQLSTGLNVNQGNSQFAFETTYDGFGTNGFESIAAKIMYSYKF